MLPPVELGREHLKPQGRVLLLLVDEPTPWTYRALSSRLGMSLRSIRRAVALLERKLLVRIARPEGREALVTLIDRAPHSEVNVR